MILRLNSPNCERNSVIYLNTNLVETKFAVRKIITVTKVTGVTCVLKNSQIWISIKQLLKNIDFSRNCSKFHIFTKFQIFNGLFSDQLPLPYNFHGNSLGEILLFNFASCERSCKGVLPLQRQISIFAGIFVLYLKTIITFLKNNKIVNLTVNNSHNPKMTSKLLFYEAKRFLGYGSKQPKCCSQQ